MPYALNPEIKFPVVILPRQPVSGATNSDFGIWNQPPGSNMYPHPPPLAPPLNVVGPPGEFGAPGYYGPPLSQFLAPGYTGPLGLIPPPIYPGPPGQFGPSVSQQSDPSAPPPYQEYQLYPQLPDHAEKW